MRKVMLIIASIILPLTLLACSEKTSAKDNVMTTDQKVTTTENNLPYIDHKKLVVFGDSISAIGTWGESVADDLNMYFYNAAMGGITTEQGLTRFDAFVRNQNPDFVTILFGHNDLIMQSKNNPRVTLERFKENLKTFVTWVREIGATPILLTNAPLNEEIFFQVQGQDEANYTDVGTPLEWLDQYNEAIREVAREMECDLVDNRITFSDQYYKTYLSDGIHLNSKGNEKFRNNLKAYFLKRYRNDPAAEKITKEDTYIQVDESNKKASIASFDPKDYYQLDNTLIKIEATTNGISFYNTNGLWPDCQYALSEPIIVSVKDGYITYDVETKNVTSSIVLFFDGATASAYTNDKYIVLNQFMNGKTNSVGDLEANQHLTGRISLSELGLTKSVVHSGKLIVSGLKIFVAGNSNQKVIINDLSIAID